MNFLYSLICESDVRVENQYNSILIRLLMTQISVLFSVGRDTNLQLFYFHVEFCIYRGLRGLQPLDPSARWAEIRSSYHLREKDLNGVPTSEAKGVTHSLKSPFRCLGH